MTAVRRLPLAYAHVPRRLLPQVHPAPAAAAAAGDSQWLTLMLYKKPWISSPPFRRCQIPTLFYLLGSLGRPWLLSIRVELRDAVLHAHSFSVLLRR